MKFFRSFLVRFSWFTQFHFPASPAHKFPQTSGKMKFKHPKSATEINVVRFMSSDVFLTKHFNTWVNNGLEGSDLILINPVLLLLALRFSLRRSVKCLRLFFPILIKLFRIDTSSFDVKSRRNSSSKAEKRNFCYILDITNCLTIQMNLFFVHFQNITPNFYILLIYYF